MTNVAILGAGSIAKAMAATLRGMEKAGEDVCAYAVASRSQEKAEEFAKAEGFRKAYGSYEAMLQDPEVDLVYVATPHALHAEQMIACIEAGKAVLCEKAFTGNAKQAREVLALAEEKKVLVTEAIWTRYQPARDMINQLLAEGVIGEPRTMSANLCYYMVNKERILRPDLAGGALLDVGVYALNFAAMTFGTEVKKMESSVDMFETGVDRTENMTLFYQDGKVAFLQSSAAANTNRQAWIYGTDGAISVDNINNPQVISLYKDPRVQPVKVMKVPQQITGYEYQVRSCMKALAEGRIECPEMPHQETILMMEWMDSLRADWGLVYPFD